MEPIPKFFCGKLPDKGFDKVADITMPEVEKVGLEDVENSLNVMRKLILFFLSGIEERECIEDNYFHLWLRDLRAVAFDVEDIYDEFQTRKILAETSISDRGKCFPVFDLRDFTDRIKKLREKYERLVNEGSCFRLLQGEEVRIFNPFRGEGRRKKWSLQDDERFHGRQEEMKIIVAELLNFRHGDNVQVIFIVGPCGSGKTSLARNIFKVAGLEQEKEYGCLKNHFDLRIWVSLLQNFDLVRTIKEVIKAVERRECHDSTLDLLQYHLKKIIKGKRFLLVLDNMWREDLDFWDNLQTSLMDGAEGSKILVTTQIAKIASRMQTVPSVHLEGLPVDDGWLLFQDVVFSKDERNKIFKDCPDLEIIGKDIVKGCQGFPLAIKAIGSLLYSNNNVGDWLLLSRELMKNGEVAGDIIPCLKTSYDHLPLHLKHCFTFCFTFPKDYEFDKDEMVKLWMATNLFKYGKRIQIEDVGGRYFDDLLWRSFFQASDSSMKDKQKYKMPTVIHELSHQLFRYESLRINKDVIEHGESGIARYGLIYHHDKQLVTFNKIFENKGLRALSCTVKMAYL